MNNYKIKCREWLGDTSWVIFKKNKTGNGYTIYSEAAQTFEKCIEMIKTDIIKHTSITVEFI